MTVTLTTRLGRPARGRWLELDEQQELDPNSNPDPIPEPGPSPNPDHDPNPNPNPSPNPNPNPNRNSNPNEQQEVSAEVLARSERLRAQAEEWTGKQVAVVSSPYTVHRAVVPGLGGGGQYRGVVWRAR